jgi:hemolysin III
MNHLNKIREPINTITHGAGAILAFVFTVVLSILAARASLNWPVFMIFGLSMVLAFAASALYHGLRVSPRAEFRLKQFDHSAIYVLIAGTYTPVVWTSLPEPWRTVTLAGVWTVAVLGVCIKSFGFERLPEWLSLALYVTMGWFAVVLLPQFMHNLPASALLALVTGGVLYTLGVPFFAWRNKQPWLAGFGSHEVWHLFVLAGSIAHSVMVVQLIPV